MTKLRTVQFEKTRRGFSQENVGIYLINFVKVIVFIYTFQLDHKGTLQEDIKGKKTQKPVILCNLLYSNVFSQA